MNGATYEFLSGNLLWLDDFEVWWEIIKHFLRNDIIIDNFKPLLFICLESSVENNKVLKENLMNKIIYDKKTTKIICHSFIFHNPTSKKYHRQFSLYLYKKKSTTASINSVPFDYASDNEVFPQQGSRVYCFFIPLCFKENVIAIGQVQNAPKLPN